ncbi:MAG TPA: non-ribosomal peptide synthetase [Pyrinomonadaceae bacterium]
MQRLEKLIFEQADKTPEAVAVEYNGARLSYRELKEQAVEYSHRLQVLGLTSGQSVAVLQERSLKTLPLMLGIWEAGGVVVPINPNTPPKMLGTMLEDASARIMVTDDELTLHAPNSSNGAGPRAENQADDCYVIYTSGSEGRPKGVVGTHSALVQYLNWQVKEFAVQGTDVFSQTAPLSFDFSLKELLVPLLCGARVCIADRSTVMDARKFVSWAQDAGITIMCCVPTLLRSILQLPGSPAGGNLFPSLRALLISGDMLRWDDVSGCRERFGNDVALFNLYGPTESTIIKLFYPIPETRAAGSTNVPVGRPIDDAEVLVVDENDCVCEAGETGQIVILSPWLARGYLHGERMAAQPFCTVEHNGQQSRAYRSGDVGRWLIDGNLELMGRKDRQVKIRGYRIELNEIESILSEHSGITDVGVVTSNGLDQDGLTAIYCYFTSEDPNLTAKDLRSFAKERLLPQVVSLTRFCRLDKLPLSANGKVDRQSLQSMCDSIEDETAESTNDESQTVLQRISSMWKEVLALEGINPEANFFELGGDSMTAIRLLRRLREEIHPAVKLDDVYEFPSISQLSNRVEQLLA